MVEINNDNKIKCCGCTACFNKCPKNAITMVEDFEGFLYPVIDKNKCINCGICDKVCPIITRSEKKNDSKMNNCAYIVRTKEKEDLKKSTSGGFFTPIAKYVLENNGIVVGVGYNEKFKIQHMIIEKDNSEQLKKMKGSKYVQSYLGNTFSEIKNLLEQKRIVLFSGTPCQVDGLLNFLEKKYENLWTIDLICHGVPSPKLWERYIDYQEKKYKSKIKEFNFRNKTYGYHSGTMKIKFENNKTYYGSARVDYMLKSFFSEISSRPSCYDCKFKTKNHKSDFTIFDCWHAKELNNDIIDDDKGYTNLFINTDNGKKIFNMIKANYILYEGDFQKAIEFDGSMVEYSAVPNKNRKYFYEYLNNHSLKQTINKFLNISQKDYIVEKIKAFIYKLNILAFLKKIIRR